MYQSIHPVHWTIPTQTACSSNHTCKAKETIAEISPNIKLCSNWDIFTLIFFFLFTFSLQTVLVLKKGMQTSVYILQPCKVLNRQTRILTGQSCLIFLCQWLPGQQMTFCIQFWTEDLGSFCWEIYDVYLMCVKVPCNSLDLLYKKILVKQISTVTLPMGYVKRFLSIHHMTFSLASSFHQAISAAKVGVYPYNEAFCIQYMPLDTLWNWMCN